jgi:hypothetical protein
MSLIENESKYNAASPATSGSDAVLEHATGTPRRQVAQTLHNKMEIQESPHP